MPDTATRTESSADVKQLPPYNVVLLDDDDHSYDYVIRMMGSVFGYDQERAFRIAERVDTEGRVVCMTAHKELAELKRDQILSFGRDALMARSRGSMSAVIEPAFADGDESEGG